MRNKTPRHFLMQRDSFRGWRQAPCDWSQLSKHWRSLKGSFCCTGECVKLKYLSCSLQYEPGPVRLLLKCLLGVWSCILFGITHLEVGGKNLGVTLKLTTTFWCNLLWQVLNSFLIWHLFKIACYLPLVFRRLNGKPCKRHAFQRLKNSWRIYWISFNVHL